MTFGTPKALEEKPPQRFRLRLAACAVCLLATTAAAQEDPPPSAPLPTAGARLLFEDRSVTAVSVTLAPDGPRFALAPIAAALGATLRVGPLGDSHTLIYEDRQIILGPGQATMVTVAADGRTQKAITHLARMPIRDGAGLKVSLDVLEKALGDPLNFRFAWNAEALELAVTRPELRRLRAAINLVHQYQVSLVEIELSAQPRYLVERPPGALEIRLVGDQLELPVTTPRAADPLVERITVAPGGVRLDLADNAVADEPRLLQGPVRLVIEVSETSSRGQVAETPRTARRRAPGVRTIALDPGHGGSETGAVGAGGLAEAELALQVARALRLQLERRLPVKVVLTRNADVEVEHDTRTAIANQNQADLFISLHFNSSFGSRPHGAETYFLSREASDQMAAELAAAENRDATAAADPELDLQMILWDLAQSYHLAESQRFANLVQEELNLTLGLRDRGVKQAPFRVLMGARMPAVLVELGFLSNPEEEAALRRPDYQAELVDALVRAVIRFKRQIEASDVARGPAGDAGDAGLRNPP